MFALGLLLPLAFWAGLTGFSLPTQWAVLSLALPLGLWRRGPWTPLHTLGVLFFGYATIALAWTLNIYDGIGGLWLIGLWALAFWLGSTLTTLDGFFRGLALGLYINVAVQIAQAFGWSPVFTMPSNAAGLLFNQTVTGAALALCAVGLACYSRWLWTLPLLPGLYLAHSRAGWLALAVALLAKWTHPVFAALTLAAAALFVASGNIDISDSYRLQVWHLAVKNISLWGWGPGSFYSLKMFVSGLAINPEFAHNDYIQLLFEYGIGGLIPIAILAIALFRRNAREWPVLVAFATLACVYFPLQHAMLACISALAAGRISRDLHGLRDPECSRRSAILPGSYQARYILARGGSEPFSI